MLARVSREFPRIVLNVAAANRLDSSGLGLLVRCSSDFRKRGGDVCLPAPPPFIHEVLEVSMLSAVLPAVATEQEAVIAFLRDAMREPATPSRPGRRVLLVDRSRDLGAFVRAVLTQHGYDVYAASLVGDAENFLSVHPIDFILAGPGAEELPPEQVLGALREIAPQAAALQLAPEFASFDAHDAATRLLELFRKTS